MISSQVACDHHKVFRAELVSTPPDGLDTLTRSSKVRKRYRCLTVATFYYLNSPYHHSLKPLYPFLVPLESFFMYLRTYERTSELSTTEPNSIYATKYPRHKDNKHCLSFNTHLFNSYEKHIRPNIHGFNYLWMAT